MTHDEESDRKAWRRQARRLASRLDVGALNLSGLRDRLSGDSTDPTDDPAAAERRAEREAAKAIEREIRRKAQDDARDAARLRALEKARRQKAEAEARIAALGGEPTEGQGRVEDLLDAAGGAVSRALFGERPPKDQRPSRVDVIAKIMGSSVPPQPGWSGGPGEQTSLSAASPPAAAPAKPPSVIPSRPAGLRSAGAPPPDRPPLPVYVPPAQRAAARAAEAAKAASSSTAGSSAAPSGPSLSAPASSAPAAPPQAIGGAAKGAAKGADRLSRVEIFAKALRGGVSQSPASSSRVGGSEAPTPPPGPSRPPLPASGMSPGNTATASLPTSAESRTAASLPTAAWTRSGATAASGAATPSQPTTPAPVPSSSAASPAATPAAWTSAATADRPTRESGQESGAAAVPGSVPDAAPAGGRPGDVGGGPLSSTPATTRTSAPLASPLDEPDWTERVAGLTSGATAYALRMADLLQTRMQEMQARRAEAAEARAKAAGLDAETLAARTATLDAVMKTGGSLGQMVSQFAPRYLPFADAASDEMPLSRILRLALFQISVGMCMVLLTGTLNRVMIVEMGISAAVVALMVALPVLFAPLRLLIGFKSDTHRSFLGWRRVPFIWFGTLFQFGGLSIMPFSLILLAGEGTVFGAEFVGLIIATIAFLLVGLGMHTTQTAGLALATDLSPEENRPRIVALMYVMLMVGMMLSGLTFGVLLRDFSNVQLIQVIQGAAVVTMVLNIIALWKQEPRNVALTHPDLERPDFRESWRAFREKHRPERLLVTIGLGTAAFSMQDILLEPFGGEVLSLSVSATTVLTAILAAGNLGGFAFAARNLARGGNPYRIAALGAVIGLAAFVFVLFSVPFTSPMLFRMGTFLLGLGSGMFAVGMLTAAMTFANDGSSGLALGAWGAVQASAMGGAILLGGGIRDAVSALALNGMLGPGLQASYTGYGVVYLIEIVLLFTTLAVIGPLVRYKPGDQDRSKDRRFGLAEFPG